MPTENRSSNIQMVSVPTLLAADNDRDMLEYLAEAVETQTYGCDSAAMKSRFPLSISHPTCAITCWPSLKRQSHSPTPTLSPGWLVLPSGGP